MAQKVFKSHVKRQPGYLYYIDKKVGVNVETPDGPFYVKVNAKDGSIPVQVANKSSLIQNLVTISATLLDDNSIILTGEQQYETSELKTPGSTVAELSPTSRVFLKWAVKSRIIESFKAPPVISVPPDRAVKDNSSLEVLLSTTHLTRLFISSVFFG